MFRRNAGAAFIFSVSCPLLSEFESKTVIKFKLVKTLSVFPAKHITRPYSDSEASRQNRINTITAIVYIYGSLSDYLTLIQLMNGSMPKLRMKYENRKLNVYSLLNELRYWSL